MKIVALGFPCATLDQQKAAADIIGSDSWRESSTELKAATLHVLPLAVAGCVLENQTIAVRAAYEGFSVRKMKTVLKVLDCCSDEILDAIAAGETTFSDAENVVSLSPELQSCVLHVMRSSKRNSDGKPVKKLRTAMKWLGIPEKRKLEDMSREQLKVVISRLDLLQRQAVFSAG